jgi:hypothetical protein
MNLDATYTQNFTADVPHMLTAPAVVTFGGKNQPTAPGTCGECDPSAESGSVVRAIQVQQVAIAISVSATDITAGLRI